MSVLTVNFMSKCLNRNVTYKAIIPIESSLESDTFKKSKKLQSLYNQSINTEIGCNLTSSDSIDLNVNRYLSMLVIGDYNAKECAKKLDEDVKNSMNMTTVDK